MADKTQSLVGKDGVPIAVLYKDIGGGLYAQAIAPVDAAGAATSLVDDAAFGVATSPVVPMGALADETGPDSVNEGDIGIPRMTLNRLLRVVSTSATGSDATFSGASVDSISTAAQGFANLALGYLFNGASFDRVRTPNVFKVVALTAGTAEATIWTPTGGKKFRLMGFILTPGAGSTLTFKDGTGLTTIFAARGATDVPISPNGLGNGILSGAADRLLTVTRGTSCTLDGVVFGTEE